MKLGDNDPNQSIENTGPHTPRPSPAASIGNSVLSQQIEESYGKFWEEVNIEKFYHDY